MYGLVRTIAPAGEPITLAEAKAQCRIDEGLDHDVLLGSLIRAAREFVEEQSGRALLSGTWKLVLPRFAKRIRPPMPPLLTVSSIVYRDSAGELQTLAVDRYTVSTTYERGI